MSSLQGKVVLVVGAGGAQGSVTTDLLLDEGAKVVAADRSGDLLAELAERRVTRALETHVMDVSDEAGWDELVQHAIRAFGKVDGLVNFAAILARAGFEDTTLEQWERVMSVNLTGAWLGMKAMIPALRRSGGGSIVNIGTMDSLVGRGTSAAYQASKGGLRMMSKNAATQYGPEQIRVNCVHPGAMEERVKVILGASAEPDAVAEMMEGLRQRTPLGRLGSASDVAYAVRYLLSEESDFVTGVDLTVDGGFTVP